MTYPVITPRRSIWTNIPAQSVDTDIQAIEGPVWISDDATPSVMTAIQLRPEHGLYRVRAGRALKCTHAGRRASLRQMDA